MKKIHSLILLVACVLTTACGSSSSGLDELKRLCKKDAGLIINKTVEVDGYYDASRESGALGLLIPSGYSFTEFCNFEPDALDLFDVPGCWKLTKVPRDTKQCNDVVDKKLWRYARKGYVEFREENCIAVEKIEKPEARYSYHSDFKKWYAKNETSKFTRSDVYIKDSVTSEILGRYVAYSYNVRPGQTTAKGCEIFEGNYPSYVESNLVNTVLKPMSKGDSHD